MPVGLAENLVTLPWDSALFDFPVARMAVSGADQRAIRETLERARQAGIRLVYWQTEPEEMVPEALLREYAGRLVDQKVTYQANLCSVDLVASRRQGDGILVREYPKGPSSPTLRSLALEAGAYSRFRVDPAIPKEKYITLYTTWIERSARRELADIILIAEDDHEGRLLGMVTATANGDAGDIGLIAVAEQARGRGLGGRLVQEVHQWMARQGCARSMVVTQFANSRACGLYEHCGYHLRELKMYYHFWPFQPIPH